MTKQTEEIEALKIQRYDFDYYTSEHSGLECKKTEDGDYVLYSDHKEIITSLLEQIKQKETDLEAAETFIAYCKDRFADIVVMCVSSFADAAIVGSKIDIVKHAIASVQKLIESKDSEIKQKDEVISAVNSYVNYKKDYNKLINMKMQSPYAMSEEQAEVDVNTGIARRFADLTQALDQLEKR